jgi:hypothetical protein
LAGDFVISGVEIDVRNIVYDKGDIHFCRMFRIGSGVEIDLGVGSGVGRLEQGSRNRLHRTEHENGNEYQPKHPRQTCNPKLPSHFPKRMSEKFSSMAESLIFS